MQETLAVDDTDAIFRPNTGTGVNLRRQLSGCAVSAQRGALVTRMDNHSYDLPLALVYPQTGFAACGTRFMTGAKRR